MSRQFSIPRVLRMVPNRLLREFFDRLGHSEFDPRWPDLKEREIDPILAFLGELTLPELNAIEGALRSIFDLSCQSGFTSCLEAAPHCGVPNLGSLVPEDLGEYGRAMWVWLNHKKIFDKAQIIHRVDNLSWWRKRNDLPETDPDCSPAAREKLEEEISELLKAQGRGKDCTVEVFKRDSVIYFFAYPDDFVQNVVVHDKDGRLAPEAFRQTLLIVFAYNREEGSLETFTKLPKLLKEKLEGVFARVILHWELGSYEPDAVYELNQLKEPAFDLRPDPEDHLRIRIRKMRLSSSKSGRRLLLEVDDDDPAETIHKAIRECVNLEQSPLSEWNVSLVTFCFEFLPLDDRKPGQQSFDVSFPRSCSLRNARPERVELIQKYLKR